MIKRILLPVFLVVCPIAALIAQQKTEVIYKSSEYTIYSDRVVQPPFTAVATSDKSITSDYISPEMSRYSPDITFKFSINLRDNEMVSGRDHKVTIRPVDGRCTTLVKFGHQHIDVDEVASEANLPSETQWTLKLDLREVLSAFRSTGYFTLFNGEKLYRDDFKGVYVAGDKAPLSWDFNNLDSQPGLQLSDHDNDGIFETTLVLNAASDHQKTAADWTLKHDLSAYPAFHTSILLSQALYNLSVEEMVNAIEPDSTFRTGKEWAGVWTRDISYSIILSMAYMQPEVAKKSLMHKVKNGRIIQDTGTGGAYPVSTDRMIWAVAAWEVYKATGDHDWLLKTWEIIRNSVEDDMHNVYDPSTGLVKGESSFLDWREQTYPRWMQPADIFNSENLGTNAVHFQANVVLSLMSERLGHQAEASRYRLNAEKIRNGINQYLWLPEKGYYAQYLYGRGFHSLSSSSEALGEALCVLFGIADSEKSHELVSRVPVTEFGIPCIYPQIPGIPPYHNNAVWPFVQSYWALASAKAGNEEQVAASIAAIYRPAALFLTNKENFVATTGDYAGTQINSDNMLWSLSGNIALVHRLLFGLDPDADSLYFRPFVPRSFAGNKALTGFKIRDLELDIESEGYGNIISSFLIDGKEAVDFALPMTIKGKHVVKMVLNGFDTNDTKKNKAPVAFAPETPQPHLAEGVISWNTVKDADKYIILRNGQISEVTDQCHFKPEPGFFAEYQIIACNKQGTESFSSEPFMLGQSHACLTFEAEDFAENPDTICSDFTGKGYVTLNKKQHRVFSLTVDVEEPGNYLMMFRYANGNGPVNTENKCALRTISVNGNNQGIVVFPQRGREEWSNWGYSNPLQVKLSAGKNILQLSLETENENMHGDINDALLDHLFICKIQSSN